MERTELIRRAMRVLAPGADYVQRGEAIEWNDVHISQPTDSELEQEIARQQSIAYRDGRAAEYPPIGEQLDALFHAGVFPPDMAARIQAVKDKYPKS